MKLFQVCYAFYSDKIGLPTNNTCIDITLAEDGAVAVLRVKEALAVGKKFDIIFMDIQMPSKNGLEFYKSLSQDIKVIFTTAYSEYAVDAFDVNAVDYLVKPFSFDRFQKAIDRMKLMSSSELQTQHLLIRADYKLHKIDFEDIKLIEGLDDYIQIHLKNDTKITARSSMKSIVSKLPEKDFIRVHRSYILPVKAIKGIVNKNIHLEDFIIPVGETYKDDLKKIIGYY